MIICNIVRNKYIKTNDGGELQFNTKPNKADSFDFFNLHASKGTINHPISIFSFSFKQ